MKWRHFQLDNSPPGRRSHHCLLISEYPPVVFVCGGLGSSSQVLNDVYYLLLDKMKWEKINLQPVALNALSTATKVDDRIWFFGGYQPIQSAEIPRQNRITSNKTFYYDIANRTWNFPEVAEPLPPSRISHSSVALEASKKIFYFGGHNSHANLMNDIAIFDTVKLCWEVIPAPNRMSDQQRDWPTGRFFHALALFPNGENKIVLYGGRKRSTVLGDVWIYDLNTKMWTLLKPASYVQSQPKPRAGHSLNGLFGNHSQEGIVKFAMFGGWDGSRDENGEFGAENDFWILNINTELNSYSWDEIVLASPPAARDCHSAILTRFNPKLSWQQDFKWQTSETQLLIFGGNDEKFNPLNDVALCTIDTIQNPPSLLNFAKSALIRAVESDQIPIEKLNHLPKDLLFQLLSEIALTAFESE